jgi:hypothetical protein
MPWAGGVHVGTPIVSSLTLQTAGFVRAGIASLKNKQILFTYYLLHLVICTIKWSRQTLLQLGIRPFNVGYWRKTIIWLFDEPTNKKPYWKLANEQFCWVFTLKIKNYFTRYLISASFSHHWVWLKSMAWMIRAQEKFLVRTTDGVENHFFLQKI